MIQGIIGSRLSVRPTKKKVVNTVSAMEQGARFLEGLKENKEALMSELGLPDTEYDNLSCISGTKAMAGKAASFLGDVKHKLVKGV